MLTNWQLPSQVKVHVSGHRCGAVFLVFCLLIVVVLLLSDIWEFRKDEERNSVIKASYCLGSRYGVLKAIND